MKPLFSKTNIKKNIDTKRALIKAFMFGIVLAFIGLGFANTDSHVKNSTICTASFAGVGFLSIRNLDPGAGGGGGESEEEKSKREFIEKINLEVKGHIEKLELKQKNANDADKLKLENDIKELKEKLDGLTPKTELKGLTDKLNELGLELKAVKEGAKPAKNLSLKGQINKFIEDNHAKIKELKASGSGVLEFKVVGAMTDASVSNPDGIPDLQGVQVAPPTNVNLRTTIVDGLVTSMATSLASYPYTESVPKDGNYAFVAETGSKPQIDFKIETRYAAPKKVAAYMELSEESVTDIPGLQSIAYSYLKSQHDLKRQNGILFGDGTGSNPLGATTFGRAFSNAKIGSNVVNPNFMDVVNAAITDIFTTHNFTNEMPYMANLVMINPVDFYNQLVAAKDAFGHPLYPMASLFNRVTIGGATIVPFEDIPAGKIFVADMSKYNITNYVGYTVKIGWINDNLITNQFVIVGESRLHAFVKNLDKQAFIYDTIANIKTAITIAPNP